MEIDLTFVVFSKYTYQVAMVIVVLQIGVRYQVLKPWYGCAYQLVSQIVKVINLYCKYSSGTLDRSKAISSKICNCDDQLRPWT